jgi:iron complex transport system substrate-binding protein
MKSKITAFILPAIVLICTIAGCSHSDTSVVPGGDTLPDGEYSVNVTLTGGSGRASVESPAAFTVKEGKKTARIIWSSKYYDLMIVDGVEYLPINTEGNSVFEIPAELNVDIAVQAETTVMSEPHLIDYNLRFELADSQTAKTTLKYATQFSIEYFENGCKLIEIKNAGTYLLVPENVTAPDIPDAVILRQPIENIYIAATSTMCLFDELDALDSIKLSGTRAEDWYDENAKSAMKNGEILYAGKYSAPDYELILSHNCKLAVESSMINHSPEAKEKLEALGIPVLVDMSSYESHPLGRTEWVKLYASLFNKEETAERLFNRQTDLMSGAVSGEDTNKTAAFFSINSNGGVVARKSGDYVAKMIELAGGKYVFDNLGDKATATGTVNLEMEKFYETAGDADVIIYNATIESAIHSTDELIAKNQLLRNFSAVKTGNVWCTDKNMFQETTQIGQMISDMHNILTGNDKDIKFFYRLAS